MKKYKVNVNGTMYEITLEVCDEADVKGAAPAAKEEPKPAPAAAPAGGTQVLSPMPGNIISVNYVSGTSVKKGDVLFILEAMKMENEIMAPCDGTVTVSVSKGSAVETGALLATIA
ncbi:MAG: acetyl-CoA carboxylase biotin carboxyl carrier protein subunit [Clostridia bacterium]|nr:acetyl-CoA carboxylase biotin carboxyl carrier protein subunit [Clostridia bacterium]